MGNSGVQRLKRLWGGPLQGKLRSGIPSWVSRKTLLLGESHLFLSGGFVLTPFSLFSWSLCTLEEGYGCYQKALHTQVVSHYCGLEQSKAQPSTAPSLGGTHCKASYTVDQDETGAISPRCPYSMPWSPPQEECGLSSWVWIPLLHTWLIFL